MGNATYLTTYLSTSVFCGIVFFVMVFKVNRNIGGYRLVRTFRSLAICALVNIAMNSMWAIFEIGAIAASRPVVWAVNTTELVTTGLVVYIWFSFIVQSFEDLVHCPLFNKIERVLWVLPVAALVLTDGLSPLTNAAFYIDSSNQYVRGDLFFIHYGSCFLYLIGALVAFVRSLRKVRKGDRRRRASLVRISSLSLIPVVGGVLQVLVPGVPFSTMAITASVFDLFVTKQDERITTDALTGLNNRVRIDEVVTRKIESADGRPFVLCMADIDFFKKINDTYGHQLGDAVLVEVAEALKHLGAKHPSLFVSRYGGDEFLFTFDVADGVVIDDIAKELQSNLDEGSGKKRAFDVKVSVGAYLVSDASLTIEQAIANADTDLYEKKRVVHGLR